MITQVQAIQQVLKFLKSRAVDGYDIGPDFDLLSNGVLDSLSLTEFVILLEQLRGKPIPLSDVSADDFRTIQRIEATFLSDLAK